MVYYLYTQNETHTWEILAGGLKVSLHLDQAVTIRFLRGAASLTITPFFIEVELIPYKMSLSKVNISVLTAPLNAHTVRGAQLGTQEGSNRHLLTIPDVIIDLFPP